MVTLFAILIIGVSGLLFGASVYLVLKNDSSDFWKGFQACGCCVLGTPFIKFLYSMIKTFISLI